jgi:hypothetical protein
MIASKVYFFRDRVKPAARSIAAKAIVIAVGWATIVAYFAVVVWMGICLWQTFSGEG